MEYNTLKGLRHSVELVVEIEKFMLKYSHNPVS